MDGFLCIGASNPLHAESESQWKYIGFIEPGTKWEIDVTDLTDSDASVTKAIQWLDGSEEINGTEYMKLWVKIGDGEYSLASYIRCDRAEMCVYALSPDDVDHGECKNYDFSLIPGYREITPINWDGTLSKDSYVYHFDNTPTNSWESCGYKHPTMVVSIYSPDDANHESPLSSVTWIYGIGSQAGFLNQCYALYSGVKTELRKVSTDCSDVVFENNAAGITSAVETPVVNNIKYRLDGTLFRENEKGMYIMNGRKYIQN